MNNNWDNFVETLVMFVPVIIFIMIMVGCGFSMWVIWAVLKHFGIG